MMQISGVTIFVASGFPDDPIDFFAGKIPEREGGHEFEECNFVVLLRIDLFSHFRHARGEIGLGNGLTINLNSFADTDQMRRRVESHAETRGAKARFAECRG
jgi:hypothetical protein